jgi:hypothetical protein
MVVEQINKQNLILVNKASGDVWVWEVIDRHGIVIDSNKWVDVKLFFVYFILRSCSLSKSSQFETAIIKVTDSKQISSTILLDLLQFNV